MQARRASPRKSAVTPATPITATAAQAATASVPAPTADAVQVAWHALPVEEVLAQLQCTGDGLSSDEARRRLAEHGHNALPRPKGDSILMLLWRQIDNPLIWVLLASGVIAMLMGKVIDGAVVLGVVVLNTLIGFIQEFRAGRAIEALIEMVPETATALRDHTRVTIPAADLVPGDVVVLQSGDKVPADMRLIQVRNLKIEEAALTGESVPSEKRLAPIEADAAIGDRHNLTFGGTLVTYGTGHAVVVATGTHTELGRISDMLGDATDLETPMTRALAVIARYITIGIVVVAAVMIAFGLARMSMQGVPVLEALQDTVIFAIALAVGAIPEGLPAIVTIVLAIGVQRMAARRAIVRKLPAVETLGSTTVICSDKTGTLTRNEMTVQEIWTAQHTLALTGVGYEPTGELRRGGEVVAPTPPDVVALLRDAALCNDSSIAREDGQWKLAGDPTEGALVVAAEKLGVEVIATRAQYPRLDAIPFESENQFMATLHATPEGAQRIILKGAPEVVLARCHRHNDGSSFAADAVLAEVDRLAREGMRVLAIAAKTPATTLEAMEMEHVQDGFELVGIQGMIDPPRTEVIEAVKVCHAAGITVKMITGDHKTTAEAIGHELGLTGGDARAALSGVQLSAMDDGQLRAAATQVNVFARVAPEHKLGLVRALQREGHVVAMTGDGVNDAPALKQANIGVAMGITGTAVSKEAADIVLTDDNFASIAAAVEEGRHVYDNLIKSLAFVLPTNIGLALILMSAVMIFPFDPTTGVLLMPMQPTQLLWINLVAAVALALPLAFEAREPSAMLRPPRRPTEPVLSGFVIFRTALVALLMTAGSIGVFLYEYERELAAGVAEQVALAEAQTIAVTTVILFQIFYLLNCRSLRDSMFKIGLTSNLTVYIGIAVVLLLQLAFMYLPFMNWLFDTVPLDGHEWLTSALVASVVLPVISIEKALRHRRERDTAAAPA
jgi:magnesium-transporting ATPase (P-type)